MRPTRDRRAPNPSQLEALRRGRRRAWRLILALAVLDALALTAAPHPTSSVPPQPWRLRPRERIVAAIPPEFSREALHAVLYRSDPGPGMVAPPCNQDEPTYGQIDTCG